MFGKKQKTIDKHLFLLYDTERTDVREHIFEGGLLMKKYYMAFMVAVLILCIFFGKNLVMASDEPSKEEYRRYFKEITIKPGDSLWSIAQTYNEHSGMEIRQYVRELKRMNQIYSDDIQAGDSLTIVYFAKNEKTGFSQ